MGVPFLDAGFRRCRFPVSGEGLSLIVCGEPTVVGASYCSACHARAYVGAREPRPVRCEYSRPRRVDADLAPDLVEVMS